jgi:hypothetical protein
MPQNMQAYEIQVYQNGRWEFDSYFNDRDLVLSEAERIGFSGRYSGVRVLEETYHDETNKADCKVIFSRLSKISGPNSDWRERAQRSGPGHGGSSDPERRYTGPRQAAQPRKPANLLALVAIASGIVLVGIAAIIAIRQIAGTM